MLPAAVQGRADDRRHPQESTIRYKHYYLTRNESEDTLMIDKCIKQMAWQIVFPGISFYNTHI